MLIKESPCNTCNTDNERCSATANCAKWREWFCEVWPIVTGKSPVEEKAEEPDVVEVVRCKDCKYRPKEDGSAFGGLRFPHEDKCPLECDDPWYSKMESSEFFCAHGERKDNE